MKIESVYDVLTTGSVTASGSPETIVLTNFTTATPEARELLQRAINHHRGQGKFGHANIAGLVYAALDHTIIGRAAVSDHSMRISAPSAGWPDPPSEPSVFLHIVEAPPNLSALIDAGLYELQLADWLISPMYVKNATTVDNLVFSGNLGDAETCAFCISNLRDTSPASIKLVKEAFRKGKGPDIPPEAGPYVIYTSDGQPIQLVTWESCADPVQKRVPARPKAPVLHGMGVLTRLLTPPTDDELNKGLTQLSRAQLFA